MHKPLPLLSQRTLQDVSKAQRPLHLECRGEKMEFLGRTGSFLTRLLLRASVNRSEECVLKWSLTSSLRTLWNWKAKVKFCFDLTTDASKNQRCLNRYQWWKQIPRMRCQAHMPTCTHLQVGTNTHSYAHTCAHTHTRIPLVHIIVLGLKDEYKRTNVGEILLSSIKFLISSKVYVNSSN